MSLKLNLDHDLCDELQCSLKAAGLVWSVLPFSLQVKQLAPFMERQLARERPFIEEAMRAA